MRAIYLACLFLFVTGCMYSANDNNEKIKLDHNDNTELQKNELSLSNKKTTDSFLVSNHGLYEKLGLSNGIHYYYNSELQIIVKLTVNYPNVKYDKINLNENFKKIAPHFVYYKEKGYLNNDTLEVVSLGKRENNFTVVVSENQLIELVNNKKWKYSIISLDRYNQLLSKKGKEKIYFINEDISYASFPKFKLADVIKKVLVEEKYIDKIQLAGYHIDDVNLLTFILVEKNDSIGGIQFFWKDAGLNKHLDLDKLPDIDYLTSSINEKLRREKLYDWESAVFDGIPVRSMLVHNYNIGILTRRQ